MNRYKCAKCVAFDERKHATSVFPGNWAYIILHQEILQSLCDRSKKKAFNKVKILFETVPKNEAVHIFVHEAIGAVKRIATNLFMGDENA